VRDAQRLRDSVMKKQAFAARGLELPKTIGFTTGNITPSNRVFD